MSALKSLTCPTCGAPISISGDTAEVQCSFCGNTVIVPSELINKPPVPPPAAPQVIVVQQPVINPGYRAAYNFTPSRRRRSSGCASLISFAAFVILIAVAATLRARPDILTSAINRAISNPVVSVPTFVVPTSLSNLFATVTAAFANNNLAASSTAVEISGAEVATATPSVFTFGGKGTGAGLFTDPRTIAVDTKGNTYVADFTTGLIQRFDHNGQYTNGWQIDRGATKSGPFCVATDRNDNVYVCEFNTIFKYAGSTGKLIAKFTGGANTASGDDFWGLAVRLDGTLVAYSYHNQDDLVFMDANGRITKRVTNAASSQIGDAVVSANIAVDGLGNIYLLAEDSGLVLLFDPNGKYISRFGGIGDKSGMFNAAVESVTTDSKSNIYVGDFSGIEVLDSQGHPLKIIATPNHVIARSMIITDKNELYVLGSDMSIYRLPISTNY